MFTLYPICIRKIVFGIHSWCRGESVFLFRRIWIFWALQKINAVLNIENVAEENKVLKNL